MTRTAVITGAGRGIGRACLTRLLDEGWRVAALERDAEMVAALRARRPGPELLALETDVGDEASVLAAFEAVADWAPEGLDLLVANAAIASAPRIPIEELSLAEWRRQVDVGLTGVFLSVRSAIPLLRARRGSIVSMASTRAFQSEADTEPYSACKGGVFALTHALAVSLGPEIRANAIAPGWIETGHLQDAQDAPYPEHSEADRAQHPAGRVGRPEDIAETVLWLADASFVTGQTVVVDGGMTRKMIYAE
ncbi:SDR family oxidoreductase [Albimonas sp. CAU 1670]|uniref:SDR family oxidoreductase n=1 Tax=Albimonas sp. CAU 1670 TaxID=3032599 RepID=UPI0023D9859C|nr:SDR family oxidoreductase [Albimonas sp. CAU 1670]MDF2235224.1 SDR family oxidoreductase [Albimonas sp. CAU 1670]